MRFICTGGCGFIGHHLVRELAECGHDVIVVDNLSGGRYERIKPYLDNEKLGVSFLMRDITDSTWFLGLNGDEIDGIFHLAARPRVQYSIDNPVITNDHNVVGTLNVLEAARKLGIDKVVSASSSSVYGDVKLKKDGHKEGQKLNPLSPYALQKQIGEQYSELYSKLYKIKTACLRYFNVYGPGQEADAAYGTLIPNFVQAVKQNKPLPIYGDGEQTRDFTHVSDTVELTYSAMSRLFSGTKHFIVNVGGGTNQSVNYIASLFGDNEIKRLPARKEPKDTLANKTKMLEILNFGYDYKFKKIEEEIPKLLEE